MQWEILNKGGKDSGSVIDILLKNRGITTKKQKDEFFNTSNPDNIEIENLGISNESVKKAIKRIEFAKKNKEAAVVYGDYDADGICATAIMWETLHALGLNILPHIPDRFEEGYGINTASVTNLKARIPNLKLIVTVDNGIVGYAGIKKAKELGIDVIVIDHHTLGAKTLKAYCIIHSTKTSGSGLAYFFAKELKSDSSLELACIGTVADQLPLTDVNRSIVKFGLVKLSHTKRPGLLALFEESGISLAGLLKRPLGTYEIGFIIAPRINAMGRLKHGLESLRLLCTKDRIKAGQIARNIASTNLERQSVVEEVVILARKSVTDQKVIVIAGKNYHEGVIGLAAGRLTEEFSRPSIVLSIKGEVAKASARSIAGFNIIEAIRAVNLHLEGGGHPMAAGFSIAANNIPAFSLQINNYAQDLLTTGLLEKTLKVDCRINFETLNLEIVEELKQFEPFGLGNSQPTFATSDVEVVEAKPVGQKRNHLKLKLKKDSKIFDAIWFNSSITDPQSIIGHVVDVAYNVEENVWNFTTSLQLKVRDITLLK